MTKKRLDIAVISDVHLGTYGCHATELEQYLRTIEPTWLIINGDFIDGWQFSKKYFPESHSKVLQRVLKMMGEGVKVVYITGNHDEMLRRYSGFSVGNFLLDDKFLLELGGKKFWFFHGDVFDLSMQHGKWLAKLGGLGYDILILLNRSVNTVLQRFGYEKYSFSKKVKGSVKAALRHINNFEQTVADIAIENDYDYVVCGHIHEPVIKKINNLVWNRSGGSWQFSEPKTAKSRRTIPLPVSLMKEIKKHRIKQQTARLKLGNAWQNYDLVFPSQVGTPLTMGRITRVYQRIKKDAEVNENLRLYDLRHSTATFLLQAKVNPKVVSERLGHSTITLTLDVYSHVLPTMQQDATDQLEDMIFSKTGSK